MSYHFLWTDERHNLTFPKDKMFFGAMAHIESLGLEVVRECDFVFAASYGADGTRIEFVPTHERDPDNQGVNTAAVFRARKAARKVGLECKYWFVVYKTMRGLSDVRTVAEADAIHPWIVIEGWERGKNCGSALGQAFRRKTRTLPFKRLGPQEALGFIPVNVFDGSPAPLPPASKKLLKSLRKQRKQAGTRKSSKPRAH